MYYNSGFNYPQFAQSRSPLFLAETHSDTQSEESEQESSEVVSNGKSDTMQNQLRAQKKEEQASKLKQQNVRETLIVYFGLLATLVFCCLGRCLLVPFSQSGALDIKHKKKSPKEKEKREKRM
mmetsp:Transcript_16592/g.28249  ORF Transcript_16592/g.28249 Transcript_16592/m.28249 type:complete len:123 (+) Transcript_16592:923-1291(+)